MMKRFLIPFALIFIHLLAACSGSGGAEANRAEAAVMPETAGSEMMGDSSGEAMDDASNEGIDDDMMDEMSADMLPAWQTIALTNAVTGESFTLGDFQGKTVFVEPMATWCSNCRAQQGEVRKAKAQLGEDVVFIALSLETNLAPEELAAYAQDNGFDWTYAVMPVDLLSGLADQFGRSITNAPSTPHFIIRPDGTFSELSTGIDPAGTIVTKIQAEQG
jgi:thiol-disulfide isomerase/thioredoxin